jgi:hypothetical protein
VLLFHLALFLREITVSTILISACAEGGIDLRRVFVVVA